MKDVFLKVQKSSISLKIVEAIKDAIINGKLKVGDKLDPERKLAEYFGVGRSSIREALSILSAYGIIEIKQGKGTFITDKFTEIVFQYLGFLGVSNRQNYKNLLMLRKVIECGCVDMVIDNINNEDYLYMSNLVEKLALSKNRKINAAYDAEFHFKYIELTHNPLIINIYKIMHNMILSLISDLLLHNEVRKVAYNDHKEILLYLVNKKSNDCRDAIRNHLAHIENFVDENIKI